VKRALFLDRDGTLIVDKVYLADPAGVELLPGAAEGLRRVRGLGFLLFLFTNQSGIGRGLHTMDDALRVNARMEELLGLPAPAFDGVCIAPEAPGQPSAYRKPSPRFILEKVAEHGLEPAECWMVGDTAADVRAGRAAGVRAALLRTGREPPESLAADEIRGVPVFADFGAFAASLR